MIILRGFCKVKILLNVKITGWMNQACYLDILCVEVSCGYYQYVVWLYNSFFQNCMVLNYC